MVFNYNGMERLAKDKQSNLCGPFESYKENEVLLIWYQEPYSQHFIFFVT
jgi:hypothetical protein